MLATLLSPPSSAWTRMKSTRIVGSSGASAMRPLKQTPQPYRLFSSGRAIRCKRVIASSQQEDTCRNPQASAPPARWVWQPFVGLAGGLISSGSAHALTYKLGPTPSQLQGAPLEGLGLQPSPYTSAPVSPPPVQLPDIQIPQIQVPAVEFPSFQDNPEIAAIAFGVILAGIGLVAASSSLSKPSVKKASPATVLGILKEDPRTIFVDIRSVVSVRELGTPKLKGVKGKCRALAYTKSGDKKAKEAVVPNFGERFAKLKGIKDDTVVILLDSDGTKAPKAATDILKFLEFKKLLYVSGGGKAWKAAGIGWQEPSKGLNISLPALPSLPTIRAPAIDLKGATEGIANAVNAVGNTKGVVGTGLVIGAAAATSAVIFNEIDVLLEVVGLFGCINIVFREFLFAKQRSKKISELKELVNDRIAPQEAGQDLQRLASAVLATPVSEETSEDATPAPEAASEDAAASAATDMQETVFQE